MAKKPSADVEPLIDLIAENLFQHTRDRYILDEERKKQSAKKPKVKAKASSKEEADKEMIRRAHRPGRSSRITVANTDNVIPFPGIKIVPSRAALRKDGDGPGPLASLPIQRPTGVSGLNWGVTNGIPK